MAEFDQPEPLLEAATRAREAGYRLMDAYSPMPVEGLAEAIGFHTSMVQRLVFTAGLLGATGGFMLCWWITVVAYPHNVAGRPLNSWPAYVPITFELTVLTAALVGTASMLWLAGLPRLDHPVFSDPRFRRASQDRFFICIRADDPQFAEHSPGEAFAGLHAESVNRVLR
jgi:hypothetical protein